LAALRQDHALAGTGGGAAHAVDVRGIGIGAADHAHEQLVTGRARHLAALGQVLQAEEYALAGAATDVGGGDSDLCCVGHCLLLADRSPSPPAPLPRGERGDAERAPHRTAPSPLMGEGWGEGEATASNITANTCSVLSSISLFQNRRTRKPCPFSQASRRASC